MNVRSNIANPDDASSKQQNKIRDWDIENFGIKEQRARVYQSTEEKSNRFIRKTYHEK